MTLNALWAASAEDAVLTNVPGLQFYWGRLFDPQKARATIENLRLVRTRGSNLASDTLNTELALLFTEAVQVVEPPISQLHSSRCSCPGRCSEIT